MSNNTIYFLFLGLLLVLAQVVVFNHVCLFNVAVPFVFIYLICRLPLTMPVWQVLTAGLVLGLTVDMFSDTPGMNGMACVIIAMCRRGALRLYFHRESDMVNSEPTVRSLGLAVFLRYASTVSLIYCTVIFLLDGLVVSHPWLTVARIVFSTLLTVLLLLGVDSISMKRREKRL